MLIQRPADITPSEITSEGLFRQRRNLIMASAGLLLGGGIAPATGVAAVSDFPGLKPGPFATDEEKTSFQAVTSYNNFYEFSTDKRQPAKLAKAFKSRPWTIAFGGEIAKQQRFDVDELIKKFPPQERIYRLRCVEAWSMVIPWVGIPLHRVLKALNPSSKAQYVRFETLLDPKQFPGQRGSLFGSSLDWPYVEGLRIDEAMHPLTLLAVGLYGRFMPNQNGAPIRLVVPWKYGFKSIKSIVKIDLVDKQPLNTWNRQAPREYGFYANVNPAVDHPRWSQARERRIGEWSKRPTLPFNGYAEQVAGLYQNLDLRTNF
ncbi:MAG TPA: protein-methionine-sulfoxide reductase catalytic subunit MsrP [Gammaproteobacteria bacterium]|nr:protein-methionine-sulfoxide reductase catalytic subunit MsrP [Gammaproteobacteria bacterium]